MTSLNLTPPNSTIHTIVLSACLLMGAASPVLAQEDVRRAIFDRVSRIEADAIKINQHISTLNTQITGVNTLFGDLSARAENLRPEISLGLPGARAKDKGTIDFAGLDADFKRTQTWVDAWDRSQKTLIGRYADMEAYAGTICSASVSENSPQLATLERLAQTYRKVDEDVTRAFDDYQAHVKLLPNYRAYIKQIAEHWAGYQQRSVAAKRAGTNLNPDVEWQALVEADNRYRTSWDQATATHSAVLAAIHGQDREVTLVLQTVSNTEQDLFEPFEKERLHRRLADVNSQRPDPGEVPALRILGSFFSASKPFPTHDLLKKALQRTHAQTTELMDKQSQVDRVATQWQGLLVFIDSEAKENVPNLQAMQKVRYRMEQCRETLVAKSRTRSFGDPAKELAAARIPEPVEKKPFPVQDPVALANSVLKKKTQPVNPPSGTKTAATTGTAPGASPGASPATPAPTGTTPAVQKQAAATSGISLPELAGMKVTDAVSTLTKLGLTHQVLEGAPALKAADLNTVELAYTAGTIPIQKGDIIILRVRSKQVEAGVVPDVRGWYVDEAYAEVEAAGLVPTILVGEDTDDIFKKDRVSEQAPAGGTPAETGSGVTLKVWVWEVPGRLVPNIRGMSVPAARAALARVELAMDIVQAGIAPEPARSVTVARQYPAEGVEVPRGTGITAYVFQEFRPEDNPDVAATDGSADTRPGRFQGQDKPPSRNTQGLDFIDVPARIGSFSFDSKRSGAASKIDDNTWRMATPKDTWVRWDDTHSFSSPTAWYSVADDYRLSLQLSVSWQLPGDRSHQKFNTRGVDEVEFSPGATAGVFSLDVVDVDYRVTLNLTTTLLNDLRRREDIDRHKQLALEVARQVLPQIHGVAARR